MNFAAIGSSLLSILSKAPAAVAEGAAIVNDVVTIYGEIKDELSATDQAAIDQALTTAQVSDAAATKTADEALNGPST